ncbi:MULTISPECIES: hypothetical protein [Photorhabdus]|uniref:Uncharacterized protein n=1 Tax=Photorhabdus bodei TaxID=2029681 RepID=A0AAW6BLY4_9GAMM|nr:MULTISPECIES: hypothetical protein [Photorhabdus]MBS9423697.1 hypothetical protein [Photorhabdus caribbeanensis]MCC8465302.1 hypothetical protein [Photorhabdus bodei]MCT8354374.1 hypothetical protein [Photorhabdus kayaii]MDB6368646.1 hypothetical protein [Photorhabdus bodei]MDB6373726.1 hypothetical protein [Photorhabdus bodei]
MKILKITLSLLFLYFIYWAFGDTFFNWLFPFSPDEKKQLITVEGVAPKYTKPYVSAQYISKDCLRYQLDAGMSPYQVPTYYGLDLDVKADPQTGYFQAKLPFNGGGWCKWKINQASVTVGYTDVSHLVKDAVQDEGAEGTGLTAFINDAVRTYLNETATLNVIDYHPVIYPVLEIVNKFPKRIYLRGEKAMRPFRFMLTPGAEWKITYKPKLDETKMPKIIIPPGKEPSRVEYPDGRVDLDRDSIDYWKIK